MEQWEKEYLEVIQSRKKGNRSDYTEGQRQYINECWEEVTRPDGSKWYIPNQEAFNKQKQKQIRKRKWSAFMKKLGKTLFVLLLVFDILLRLMPYIPQEKVNDFLANLKVQESSTYEKTDSPSIPVETMETVPPIETQMAEIRFGNGMISYQTSGGTFKSFMGTAEIESFTIVEVESYSDFLDIRCEAIGILMDGSALNFYLKCYDAEGFLLDTTSVYESVSVGERFKITGSTFVPKGTSRIILSGE